mmetsp:Transcript_19431/g.17643  ORF Transcript_19431/g.17643 Transcript_19431/m.17643 type:complete len:103 (+) Transcript_19431:2-310(+)
MNPMNCEYCGLPAPQQSKCKVNHSTGLHKLIPNIDHNVIALVTNMAHDLKEVKQNMTKNSGIYSYSDSGTNINKGNLIVKYLKLENNWVMKKEDENGGILIE